MNVSLQKSNKMLDKELKDIWNHSFQTAQISIETKRLVEELNTKVSSMQNTIRMRDIREISASVIGMIIFMYLLYEIPFPITKLACALSIAWFAYVIFRLRKYKTQYPTTHLDLSVKGQLADQEASMQHQLNLLNSIAYWYAIPPFIINVVFLLGLGNPVDYTWTNSLAESFFPLTFNFKIIIIIGLAFFYSIIIWMNKRAAKKDIKPLLENIKTMQHQINNE